MKRSTKIGILAFALLFVAASVFAQDETQNPKNKVQTIFIGIDPISWVFSYYQAEIAFPISGVFEVAAQGSLLDVTNLMNTFGAGTSETLLFAHFGGLVRIFPGQKANGFFFSGRVMVLKAIASAGITGGSALDLWDLALGVDLGWRFRWWIGGWGIIFQFFAGMERAITQQQIGQILPIIPFLELHLGVCF